MRVIRDGGCFEFKCPSCGSVLEIELGDVCYNEMAHHGSPFTSTCCLCSARLNIPSSMIPQRWQQTLVPDD